MQSLKELLANYHAYHQDHRNQMTHYFSIPAILLGSLILLSWITVSIATRWHITFAWIAIILTLIYYYRLQVKLALVMTVILVILTLIATWIGYPKPNTFNLIVFIILFFGGWITLFIGHSLEKSRPAFFSQLSQVLIAPLYLLIQGLEALHLTHYFDLENLIPTGKDEYESH